MPAAIPATRPPRQFRTPTTDETPSPLDLRAEVTVPASVFEAGLQPQDIALLIFLWLHPPGSPLSHRMLLDTCQRLGWSSGNHQPIGRDAVYAILNRLISTGYLTRHQDRDSNGRLGPATYTLHHEPAPVVTSRPGTGDEADEAAPAKGASVSTASVATAYGHPPPCDASPTKPESAQVSTASVADGRCPSPPTPSTPGEGENPPPNPPPAAPQLPDADVNGSPRPRRPRRPRAARTVGAPDPTVPPPSEEHLTAARDVLSALATHSPELHLGQADVAALAPLAARWLACGVSRATLTDALTRGLPDDLRHPLGLLRHRLTHKMPTPRQETPPAPPRTPVAVDDDGAAYAAHIADRAAYAAATEPARTAAIAQIRATLRNAREAR